MEFDELIELYEVAKLELVLTDLGDGHGSASIYKYGEIQVREEDKDMAYLLSRCFGKKSLVYKVHYGPTSKNTVIDRLYQMVSLEAFEVNVCYEY